MALFSFSKDTFNCQGTLFLGNPVQKPRFLANVFKNFHKRCFARVAAPIFFDILAKNCTIKKTLLGTHCLNMATCTFFSSKYGNLPTFFPGRTLSTLHTGLCFVTVSVNFCQKETIIIHVLSIIDIHH